MRVLQICSARTIGGGERHVADLSNELTRRGHQIFAAVVHGSPMPAQMNELPAANISVFPMRNALDISSASRIARFVREKKIELINVHLAKDYPVAALAARLARIPYVITRHVLFPMNRLNRFALRGAKFVIAPSNAVAKSLQNGGIFAREKIVTVRYGLDPSRFPERPVKDRSGFVVGSIGNLDPVKGFDILIRAALIVSKAEPSVQFRIVGEDRSRDRRNETELRNLISELGLHETVTLSGWSSDVPQELSNFDVFVSASRSESFGFVIAEAMLAGVPVIATETEGAKEIIGDESLGRRVPIASPERLGRAILDLRFDEARRISLARSGRQHVHNNFSVLRMVDETESLYQRAVETS